MKNKSTDERRRHWDDPNCTLPREPHQIFAEETSAEIIGLFSRRRELLNQLAVLIALVTALSYIFDGHSIEISGYRAEILVAFSLFGATITFYVRFVQLHAGIIYNAMLFSVIEHKCFSAKLPAGCAPSTLKQELADTVGFKWDSISILLITFMALVSALSAVVFVSTLGAGVVARTSCWLGVMAIAIVLAVVKHCGVLRECNKIIELHEKNELPISGGIPELRSHYMSSLHSTHSDMNAIATTMSLVTFASLGSAFRLLEGVAAGARSTTLAPYAFLLTGCLLGFMAVVMYERCTRGIAKFCQKLKIPKLAPFDGFISDGRLGLAVVSAFFAINVGTSVALCEHYFANIPIVFPHISILAGLLAFSFAVFGSKSGLFSFRPKY